MLTAGAIPPGPLANSMMHISAGHLTSLELVQLAEPRRKTYPSADVRVLWQTKRQEVGARDMKQIRILPLMIARAASDIVPSWRQVYWHAISHLEMRT